MGRVYYESPLGRVTLQSGGGALTGLWFEGQRGFQAAAAAADTPEDGAVLERAMAWLDLYFAGKRPMLTVPLEPEGTPFCRQVWALLGTIPYGAAVTYGALAAEIARRRGMVRMSAQAVGGAVGRNPISLLIPCHRVIGADGSLTGYAAGLERKRQLLLLEGCSFTGADAVIPAAGGPPWGSAEQRGDGNESD